MRRISKNLLFFLIILVGFTNCKKDMSYYDRPGNLAQPIYQQLAARGNFRNFLKLVDRAKYKEILSSGGYWTCFAPNDAAFEKFFTENHYSSVNDISDATADKIVRYMLVYNAYDSIAIDDNQTAIGAVLDNSFKRKTTYYNWVYSDTSSTGQVRKVMDGLSNTWVYGPENNNKNIEYFTSAYFATKSLTPQDYNYFYPNTVFNGFNVLDANVVRKSVLAENGYYYEIDKVLLPQPNIYEYIKTKPEYSEFRKLLDKTITYGYVTDIQNRYLQTTGLSDSVYIKWMGASLAYSPAGEKYLSTLSGATDAQQDGWSIFVPTNDALKNYERNVLAEYYNHDPTLVPDYIYSEFLNAHMWQTTVWPSKFASTNNYLGEEARFDKDANIVDKKILSNGFFYGTNQVQKSNTFTSVYAEPFLNPIYSFMIRLMGTSLKYTLVNPNIKATLFLVTDQSYVNRGFTYNSNYNAWWWNGSSSVANQWVASAREKITNDLNLQIALTSSGELDDLAGQGIVKTYGGECIKFDNNKVFGAGNIDSSRVANVLGYRQYANGRVYFIDKMLEYSEVSPAGHLRVLAGYNPLSKTWGTPTNFYLYYKYLVASGLLTVTAGDSSRMLITGVSNGDFWTFLAPTNAAITLATKSINNPLPAYTSTNPSDVFVMKRFVLYHILNKVVIANGDEGDNGKTNTAYKNLDGITQTVTLNNQKNNLQIKDLNGGIVNVINASSNNLSSKAVIHQVDNYLNITE